MPPQARIGDPSQVPADAHGCPGCPHIAVGPAISGSPNVVVNRMPAVRVGDAGIHAACCGENIWIAKTGSRSVLINGRPAHRLGDMVRHCGGGGRTIQGSPNVYVGDNTSSQPTKTTENEVSHEHTATVSVVDALGRNLKGIKARVKCPHRPIRPVMLNGETSISNVCKGAEIEILNNIEDVRWYR